MQDCAHFSGLARARAGLWRRSFTCDKAALSRETACPQSDSVRAPLRFIRANVVAWRKTGGAIPARALGADIGGGGNLCDNVFGGGHSPGFRIGRGRADRQIAAYFRNSAGLALPHQSGTVLSSASPT